MDTKYILQESNTSILRKLLETLNWPISIKCIDCILPYYKLLNDALRDIASTTVTELLVIESHRCLKKYQLGVLNTPLHYAVLLGNELFVNTLIGYSFSTVRQNVNGETPIHLAVKIENNSITDCLLLKVKKDVNPVDNEGLSHFHIACMRNKTSIVKEFLDQKIEINQTVNSSSLNWPDYSPLHFAVKYGCTETVKLLVGNGADTSVKDNFGRKPINLAKLLGNKKIVYWLADDKSELDDSKLNNLPQFHLACVVDKPQIISNFIKNKVSVNQSIEFNSLNFSGYTPLHMAVLYKCIENVKILLKNNADISARDSQGNTPLHLADQMQSDTLVDLLLSSHDKKFINPVNRSGLSHFHIACKRKDSKVVNNFIKRGASINKAVNKSSEDFPGYTPLHFAVRHKCFESIILLINNNADITATEIKGNTPLHIADLMYNTVTTDLFLSNHEKINKNPVNNFGISHFHIACKRGSEKVVKMFLKHGVPVDHYIKLDSPYWPGYTALHFAVENENLDLINLLLNHNANIYLQNANGLSALHLANQISNQNIIDLLIKFHLDMTLNPVDNYGLSHFHIVCTKDDEEIVHNFLRQQDVCNCKIDKKSELWPGYTPLHLSVKFNKLQIVEKLLSYNVDKSVQDEEGLTPLHLACQPNDDDICKTTQKIIWELLEEKRFNLVETMQKEPDNKELMELKIKNKCEIIKHLLNQGYDVNKKDNLGKTPIFHAYNSKHMIINHCDNPVLLKTVLEKKVVNAYHCIRREIIKLLLTYDADINIKDSDGYTLLHISALLDTYSDFSKNELEILELYISKGININARNNNGFTPLHLASENGNYELVELLLKHEAEINCADNNNNVTPLHLAALYDHENIINLLLNKGSDVYARDSKGRTILHNLLKSVYSYSDMELIQKSILKAIDFGVSINAQDEDGNSALHIACLENNVSNIKLLLDNGADINIENSFGKTPPMLSRKDEKFDLYDGLYNFSIFLNEIEKNKMIGLNVNSNTISTYTKLLDPFSYSTASILVKQEFNQLQNNNFFIDCEKEIQEMKNINISKYCTLYDILFKTSNQMVTYAENPALINIIKSDDFEKKFKQFKNLLKVKFKEGSIRKKFVEPAIESLNILLPVKLPDLCCRKIVGYLDIEYLNILIQTKLA